MADWYKEVTSLGHAVISKTRLSNAMGTPLALVVLVTLPSLIIFSITSFWPLLLLAVLPPLYFIRAFDYIMKTNPNLLRTEEHEERMLQIRVGAMGEKKEQLPEEAVDALPPVSETSKSTELLAEKKKESK